MIDDSILSMVAIGLTLLFLGLINGFQFAQTQLPPDALPQLNVPRITPGSTTGDQAPLIKPGTLITGALAPLSAWVSTLGHDHPLVGRIWSADRQDAVLPSDAVNAAAEADVVLIGETHDNPDHHKLQAWLIKELSHKGKHPGVVMEMIGADKAEALASVQVASNPTPDIVGAQLDWGNSGWPAWSMYRPIVEAAMAAGYPILPGDASKTQIRDVGDNGLRAITEAERDRLALNRPLPARLGTALTEDLKVSHCNQLPDAEVAKMLDVQRFRDSVLADNVLKAVQKDGSAVLIAGDGHVRSDRGVPYYLRARSPNLKIFSILLKEVEPNVENPADALPRDPDGKPAANLIWFTARSDRVDPCDALRQQLQQKSGTG